MSAFSLVSVAALCADPSSYQDQTLTLGGWLTSARHYKKVSFLVLSDGSSLQTAQLVVPTEVLERFPEIKSMGIGCSIRCQGRWVASQGQGQSHEFQVDEVLWVGMIQDPETYPIQRHEMSPDFLRTVPHLRPRVSTHGAIARVRHTASQAIHDFLDQQGFLWVATSILTDTDAEGAGARFRVTTSAPRDVDTDGDFFAKPTYLTVSGQLEGEALCSALSRIYTFGPTFRAEQSHTSRHLAEFWMVEPEMAFASLPDLIQLAQGLLQHVVQVCLSHRRPELEWFASQGGRSILDWEALALASFEVITYTQAIEYLLQSQEHFEDIVEWGMDLRSEHEKWLVAQWGRPVVVTDYPSGIKSFYMKTDAEGKTVQAMDVLVPDMGELMGGSVREEDLTRLTARMKACGMDIEEYTQYLDLRRYGSVPHGGFGLGFERLIAYLTSASSIKDAIAYPKTAGM